MNINLLPIRERKNYAIFISAGILVLIALIATTFITMSYNKRKDELADAEMQLDNMKSLREIQKEEYNKVVSTNEIESLKREVKLLNEQPNNTVELMKHLIELLPKRGFFRDIEFNKEDVITVEVQFDSIREASTYLNALSSSAYIKDVAMDEMAAEEFALKKEEEEEWKKTELLIPRYLTKYTITLDQKEVAKLKKENVKKEEEI
ncbi:MAG TPA: hypothetical protein VLA13_08465 [Massilibacterium sp.]|nr:hypothetical protein [Massilibacterium sp.]